MVVGRKYNDDGGSCGVFSISENLEAGVFGLVGGRGTGAQGDGDFCHAGIAQVLGVGMALTAIADNGDFLALDQADVSVTIIINTHFDNFPSTRFTSPPHVRGGYENPSPASAGLRWSWREIGRASCRERVCQYV